GGITMDLATQRILITGGTRGIGLELARELTRRGAEVAVSGRTELAPARVADLYPGARYFRADLGSAEQVRSLVERLRSDFGPVTMLVNNAGVQLNHDWTETREQDRECWARMEATTNLVAPLSLTALLLDDLVASPAAAVVNVTSGLALAPKRSAPVYSATKAALRSFTQGLRYQLADHPHVRVIEVVPPIVDTGMTAGRGEKKMAPQDVAEAVADGIVADREEIWIGKSSILRVLFRIAPGLVARMMRDA
ncbi:MAG: SDR family NAD(P)-dependent oxidoreductase, partial [Gemmatimonadota bacterium]